MSIEPNIKVSIICNAYNHEQYIRSALDGFVMQKTDFAFEVLIHDDASTDRTADIIREYEIKYPHLIKPIYQAENQYSKNGISQFQYPRVKGKYIAACEGDDYWTDPLKLQKQFDAMEAHPEVDICAHGAVRVDANTGKKLDLICPANHNTILATEDVIYGGGGYVATASLFYRTNILVAPPKFRQFLCYDYTLQIHGALRGGMLYLSDCMSVYRALATGSWSTRMLGDQKMRQAHDQKVVQMLNILNEETAGKYDSVIQKKLLFNEFRNHVTENECKKALSKKYREIFKTLPIKNRVSIRIKAVFPFLTTLMRNLKK